MVYFDHKKVLVDPLSGDKIKCDKQCGKYISFIVKRQNCLFDKIMNQPFILQKYPFFLTDSSVQKTILLKQILFIRRELKKIYIEACIRYLNNLEFIQCFQRTIYKENLYCSFKKKKLV